MVLPEELALLAAQKVEAAEREDYRTAAALKTMIEVLTPRQSPLPLPLSRYITEEGRATAAEADITAATAFFWQWGFCVVPGRVAHATLSRVRAAWPEAEAVARASWEEKAAISRGRWGLSWASGAPSGYRTFFDLGDLTGGGKNAASPHWDLACALVEVAAFEPMLKVAEKLLGPDARPRGIPSGRVVPPEASVPGPTPGSRGGDGGYTSWHRVRYLTITYIAMHLEDA